MNIRESFKKIFRVPLAAEGFWIVVALLGILAGVILTGQIQNIRNKAFTGYSTSTQNFSSPLTYANPSDIPQNDSLISDKSSQGLFYTYAKRYQNARPEIQKVSISSIGMTGSVFYFYIPNIDTTYLFSRFENLPPLPNKILHVWLASSFEREYFHVATTEFVVENKIPVAYDVFVGKGNLKTEGTSLIWSYDNVSDTTSQTPEGKILTVNF